VSTRARDRAGACAAAAPAPLTGLINTHVLAGERNHGDNATMPVLAKGKTVTGRLWIYVRDDSPFGGSAAPAAMFVYSRDRTAEHLTGICVAGRASSRPMPTPDSAVSAQRRALRR